MAKDYFPCDMSEEEKKLPTLSEIEYIYSHIGDKESKRIFEKRFLYSMFRDEKYLYEMITAKEEVKSFRNTLKNGAYIYGAGLRGKRLCYYFNDIDWKGLIDRSAKGSINGIPILGLEKIKDVVKENEIIVISIKNEYDAVKDYLLSLGVNENKIIIFDELLKEWLGEIYFDKRCLHGIDKCEGIFLDIGCYNGDDAIHALEHYKSPSFKVHSFEPELGNYEVCKSKLENNKFVELYKKGVSSTSGIVYFKEDDAGSRIDENGEVEVEVTTIDEHVGNNKVGFIKMDIEGVEEAALEGGKNTIKRDKPILALSIYHKRSDIWRLPLKVLEINPEYRLEFEQHVFSWSDTVMYAIPWR